MHVLPKGTGTAPRTDQFRSQIKSQCILKNRFIQCVFSNYNGVKLGTINKKTGKFIDLRKLNNTLLTHGSMHWSAQDAITKYHRLDGLNNTYLFLSVLED
jgi:hypothetical protein